MPKIVNKKEKRTAIARQAMALFAQKGFENTAIREITAKAGMGKGTFYDYFSDKNDILNEMASLVFSEWQNMFMASIQNLDDPVEKLRALTRTGIASASDFEQMTLIYIDLWRIGVGHGQYDAFMGPFREFLMGSRTILVDIFEDGKNRGIFRKDTDSEAMALALIALIDGLCFHYLIFKTDFDPLKVGDLFFDNFIRGLT